MVHGDAWTVIPAATGCSPVTIRAVWRRHYRLARIVAVAEILVLLAGWALAQDPCLVAPDLTFTGPLHLGP